jgi:hypothetical protein
VSAWRSILTDLVLLPVLVSYVHFDAGYCARASRGASGTAWLWQRLGHHAPRTGARDRGVAALLGARWKGRETPIDTQVGVPSCGRTRATTATTTSSPPFSIGVDVLTAIADAQQPVCVSHELMSGRLFRLALRNVPGCRTSSPRRSSPRWRSPAGTREEVAQHPARADQLTQSTHIETSTGSQRELRRWW